MAEFGISMDGRAPVTDIPAQAKAAEEGGASTLWIACHLYLRDPITMAALALGATRRIKIALMAMSPYSVHPVFIAMAAATLDEMYPGRVILCLGAGAPADLKAAGLEATKPLVSIGETVKICRALLAGEMADFQGQMFRVSGRRLANGGRKVPIVLAFIRLRHQLADIFPHHLSGRVAKNFFCRRIKTLHHSLVINGNDSIQSILDQQFIFFLAKKKSIQAFNSLQPFLRRVFWGMRMDQSKIGTRPHKWYDLKVV